MNKITKKNKYTLGVIPSDSLMEYEKKGTAAKLEEYYNPRYFFKDVYLLSPLEREERTAYGMKVVPTKDTQLPERIKEHKIDIVRAYGGYWPCDMACCHKVSGVPVVVSLHDRRPHKLHDSIKNADFIFPVSENIKKLLYQRKINRAIIWDLPNRVDFEVMRSIDKSQLADLSKKYPFKYRILHVGRKSPEKNINTLIRALEILGLDYAVITIGAGNPAPYLKIAESLNVANRCFFIEKVENSQLPQYYSFTDCLCQPSLTEAMSFSLIEGLACESVVITSEVAAAGANINHNVNGLIIKDPQDPNALAFLIRRACEESGIRNCIKLNTRKSVEKFEKTRIDSLEVEYYQRILKMKESGRFVIGPAKAFGIKITDLKKRIINRLIRK